MAYDSICMVISKHVTSLESSQERENISKIQFLLVTFAIQMAIADGVSRKHVLVSTFSVDHSKLIFLSVNL